VSEQLLLESEAYKNFVNSIDSEATKESYRKTFPYFMKFCQKTSYDDMLVYDKTTLEGLVRDYIIHLRHDKRLAPASVSLYIAAICHFYEMNDVTINWRKLKKFKARHRNVVEDRPYTREQIKTLLSSCSLRDKAIILIMCSAGLRRGALPNLRIRDIKKIEKYRLYSINVYKKEQENYLTFCTPECAKAIDQYIEYRQRQGENITPNSPLFRATFDPILQANRPKPISSQLIATMIQKVLDASGVRAPNEIKKRSELMQTHGFRKYFKTTCINAGMNPLYSEYVMGHRSGLTKSYFKPNDMELLEGNDKALGYTTVINDLTIEEENRLHKKVDELVKQKDEIELREIKHREEMISMRKEMENRFQQILARIDINKIT
jgi:integrase